MILDDLVKLSNGLMTIRGLYDSGRLKKDSPAKIDPILLGGLTHDQLNAIQIFASNALTT